MTDRAEYNRGFEDGAEAVRRDLTTWAMRKFDETGEKAWLNFATEFYETSGKEHLEEADELRAENERRKRRDAE